MENQTAIALKRKVWPKGLSQTELPNSTIMNLVESLHEHTRNLAQGHFDFAQSIEACVRQPFSKQTISINDRIFAVKQKISQSLISLRDSEEKLGKAKNYIKN
eukprot:c12593_g1_i1.p1 GENE.c12593_g1_i1~~c12593_g1_i1.p1  ORF type:complete len:103 (-),score=17.52 c12593_g1_i1:339-647(-)